MKPYKPFRMGYRGYRSKATFLTHEELDELVAQNPYTSEAERDAYTKGILYALSEDNGQGVAPFSYGEYLNFKEPVLSAVKKGEKVYGEARLLKAENYRPPPEPEYTQEERDAHWAEMKIGFDAIRAKNRELWRAQREARQKAKPPAEVTMRTTEEEEDDALGVLARVGLKPAVPEVVVVPVAAPPTPVAPERRPRKKLTEAEEAARLKRIQKYNEKRRKIHKEQQKYNEKVLIAKRAFEDAQLEAQRVAEDAEVEAARIAEQEPVVIMEDVSVEPEEKGGFGDDGEDLKHPIDGDAVVGVFASIAKEATDENPVAKIGRFLYGLYVSYVELGNGRFVSEVDVEPERIREIYDAVSHKDVATGPGFSKLEQLFKPTTLKRGVVDTDSDDEPLLAPKVKKRGGFKIKRPKLSYDLSPTGDGAWAAVCRKAAERWTKNLTEAKEAGTIPKGAWDGKPITPEQWNRGGDNEWLFAKFGPDRRSKYQVFTRQQRRKRDLALRSESSESKKEELKEELKSVSAELKSVYAGVDVRKMYDWQLSSTRATFLTVDALDTVTITDGVDGPLSGICSLWSFVAAYGACFYLWKNQYVRFAVNDIYRLICVAYQLPKRPEELMHPGIRDSEWDENSDLFEADDEVTKFLENESEVWGSGSDPSLEIDPGISKDEYKVGQKRHALGFKGLLFYMGLVNMYYAEFKGESVSDEDKKVAKNWRNVLLDFELPHTQRLQESALDEVLKDKATYVRAVFMNFVEMRSD